MKTFAAADLSRNTGDLLEAATRAPVAITRHRKPRFVVMSFEQFEALTQAGDRKAYGLDELPPDIGEALDAALDRDLGDG
jgi:prevent-host-death family protein